MTKILQSELWLICEPRTITITVKLNAAGQSVFFAPVPRTKCGRDECERTVRQMVKGVSLRGEAQGLYDDIGRGAHRARLDEIKAEYESLTGLTLDLETAEQS